MFQSDQMQKIGSVACGWRRVGSAIDVSGYLTSSTSSRVCVIFPVFVVMTLLHFLTSHETIAAHLVYFDENGGTGGPRGFYNFDTTSGVSSLRAEVIGGDRFFSIARRPSDRVIFAIGPNTRSLYVVDINAGTHSLATALVGDSNVISDILNIAFDPVSNTLYGAKRNGSGLYAIDPFTGQVSLIGPATGVRAGLAFAPDGTLYGTGSVSSNTLYSIDPSTGISTLIGGGGTTAIEDGTITADGAMFATGFNGGIFQYDLTTGVKTLVGSTGMGDGLLGIIEVPEPGTVAINVIVAVGLFGFSRRRRRVQDEVW